MSPPSECTMKRSTPWVEGWCAPLLSSISPPISLVKTTSVIVAPSCYSARPRGPPAFVFLARPLARLRSSLCGRLADLEKIQRAGPCRRAAVGLFLFAVVLPKRLALPAVRQLEPPEIRDLSPSADRRERRR